MKLAGIAIFEGCLISLPVIDGREISQFTAICIPSKRFSEEILSIALERQ